MAFAFYGLMETIVYIVINPQKRASRVLVQHASFIKPVRKWALSQSQFPPTLQDAKGVFYKPTEW